MTPHTPRRQRASISTGEVNHRRAILEVLDDRCGRFEYLDENTGDYVKPGCPICLDPLRVTFRGELVDLECMRGCSEADVVARLFGRAAR